MSTELARPPGICLPSEEGKGFLAAATSPANAPLRNKALLGLALILGAAFAAGYANTFTSERR